MKSEETPAIITEDILPIWELKLRVEAWGIRLPSLVPRPCEKKVAWYPLFAHVRPFPEKPGNPRMFGNGPYNLYVYVRFISVSSVMAASLLILLACRMVFRLIDAQKVSGSSILGSCLPLKSVEGQICD